MRETDLVYAILAFLAARGVMAWRNNTGGMSVKREGRPDRYVKFNKKGSPDILGFMPPNGRGLAIECKRAGEKATPAQLAFIEEARRHGVLAFVTDDMDEAMGIINLELNHLYGVRRPTF